MKHQRSSSSAAALPPATCVNTEWTIDYSAVKFPRPRITVTADSITTSVLDCPVAWSGQYSSIVPGYAAALTVQLGSCQADANIPSVEIRDVDEMPGDIVRKEIWFHYGSVPCGGCGLHYQAGLIVTRMNDTPPPPTITLAVEAHNALSSAGPFVVSAADTPSFSVTETHTSGSPCYPATPVIAWQTPTFFRAADFYDAQKDSLIIPASASAYAFYPAGTPDELYILPRAVIDDENGSGSGSALIHLRLKEHCPLVVMSQEEILNNDTATIVTVDVKKKLKYGGITSYPPNTLFTVGIISGQGYGTLMNPAGDTADVFESTAIPLRFVPDTSFHGSLGEVTIRGYEAAEERTTARGTPSTRKAKPDTRPAARLLPPGTCDPDAGFRILGLHHLEIVLGTDDIAFTESTPMYVIGKTIVNSDYAIKEGTRITVALSGEVDYATFIVGDDTLKTPPAAFELVYSTTPSVLPQFAGIFKNHTTAANVTIHAHVAGDPNTSGQKAVNIKEKSIRIRTVNNIPAVVAPLISYDKESNEKLLKPDNMLLMEIMASRGGVPLDGHEVIVHNMYVHGTGGHTHTATAWKARDSSDDHIGFILVDQQYHTFPYKFLLDNDGKKNRE
ncbi:MAG: hypothetical protein F9K22_14195 [Bacteroidetes bacterium]|nr:MAG: hypothetical protein F9K22_14195 [Bacteroidota bacterium]